MEQFIILLIWLGMGLFGLIAKARNKQQRNEPPDDWLDEQWQELVQQSDPPADEPEFQAPKPPPLPQETKAVVPVPRPRPSFYAPEPPPSKVPAALAHGEIGEAKKRRSGGKRHTSVAELLRGRNALRRSVLLREVIDRPRAYDV